MSRSALRLLAALLITTIAACSDAPTESQPGSKEEAKIGFAVNLAGLSVNLLVVQVTASDITTPLAFNIPVSNGAASGTLTVPPGAARTITVRAYDASGALTHEGSATVDVRPGQNVNVPVTLSPRAGHVPITINIGSLVVTVARAKTPPATGDIVGDTLRLLGTVAYATGGDVPGAAVRWATLNPAVATVDSLGLVTARGAGTTQVVGTYGGFGGALSLTFIVADGSNGTPDRTAPTLITFEVSPDTANMALGNTVDVTFAATAEDVGNYYAMSVALRSPDGSETRDCYYSSNPQPGRSTRSCTITLSRYGKAGRWTVSELFITDNQGNGRTFNAAALAAAGHDSGVTVVNTAVDSTAPTLLDAEFTPDSIGPGSGYSQVTIRIHASDAQAGIEKVEVAGRHDSGTFFFGGGGSREVSPGVWESYLLIDSQYPPAGVLRLEMVRLTDRAGNVTALSAEQLDAMGMRATLTIVR